MFKKREMNLNRKVISQNVVLIKKFQINQSVGEKQDIFIIYRLMSVDVGAK